MSTPSSATGVEPEAGELDGLLCFDLYAASRAVLAIYRPRLAELGLTYPQYLVLVLLWTRDSCAIKELATTLRLDHGTLTPLLQRMAAAGLVTRERSAEDERTVLITVTPAGRALRSHFEDIQCLVGTSLGLTPDEVTALQTTLRVVIRAASAAG